MREIKFRAWYEEKMDYNVPVQNSIMYVCGECSEYDTPNIVMQYTGLKDKNGVEIYEGDLLQFSDRDKPEAVVFGNGAFGTQRYPGDTTPLYHWFGFADVKCEVVGNIYEDKNLLQ